MTTAPASPERILEVLARFGVDYVVIGGVAAILQGVPLPRTLDLDVAASHGKTNLEKLSAALKDMDAKLRVGTTADAEAIDAPIDARMLAGVYVATLMTRFGPFDVLFELPACRPTETSSAAPIGSNGSGSRFLSRHWKTSSHPSAPPAGRRMRLI